MNFVNTTQCKLRIQWDGPVDAPVLVLSNSLGCDLTMWEPQMSAFTQTFRVLRYDSRGHGASDVPAGSYTIEMLGRDVVDVLDQLGLEQVHFCGLSMGGMAGMWLGIHAPQRLRRLVLANTTARLGPPELWSTRIAKVKANGMDGIWPIAVERWFTRAFRERAPAEVEHIRKVFVATPPQGYIACCGGIRDMDQRAQVSRISVPTLVITATHDLPTPPADGRFLTEQIKGAQYIELDTAHISNIGQPTQFTDAVLQFLHG